MPNTALLIKNPLAATHEFKQACQLCYPKTGKVAPSYSSPLPRAAGNFRSADSRGDRLLVQQSERSVGTGAPQGFRAGRDMIWELGAFRRAGREGPLLALLVSIMATL